MASIFSKIIAGEIPCYKIAEDERCFAFLDINPVAPGHTLVVPKNETDYIFDLTDEDYQAMWQFARKVAQALKAATGCVKVGVAVIGLEVRHAHIHLVPMNSEGDMNFANKSQFPAERMQEIARNIQAHF